MLTCSCPNQEPFDVGLVVYKKSSLSVFTHRSLQVFLSAWYFIQMVDDGKDVEHLLSSDYSSSLFLTNSLFLYFSLSLLQKKSPVVFCNAEKIYRQLVVFVLKHIDFTQLDFADFVTVYPVMNYVMAHSNKDELTLKFINDVLSYCKNTSVLILNLDLPASQITSDMMTSSKSLRCVMLYDSIICNRHNVICSEQFCSDVFIRSNVAKHYSRNDVPDTRELHVIMQSQPHKIVDETLQYLQESGREYSLYFITGNISKPIVDLSNLIQPKMCRLTIDQSGNHQVLLSSENDLHECKLLTHLSLNCPVDDSVLRCLAKAVKEGNMPNISHLRFSLQNMKDKLQLLFCNKWTNLTHLDLTNCKLNLSDVQIICATANLSKENPLPSLTSLAVSPDYIIADQTINLFQQPWSSLSALTLTSVGDSNSVLVSALKDNKFPNLLTLEMTDLKVEPFVPNGVHNLTLGITESRVVYQQVDIRLPFNMHLCSSLVYLDLSSTGLLNSIIYIFQHRFSSLESLTLHHCQLEQTNLRVLAQANVENKLPKLRLLDISCNKIYYLECLFDFDSKWNSLQCLKVDWVNKLRDANSHVTWDCLVLQAQSGGLCALEEFNFFVGTRQGVMFQGDVYCYECLKRHNNYKSPQHGPYNESEILKPVVNSLEQADFPCLNSIFLHSAPFHLEADASAEKLRLRRKNISV